MGWLRRSKWSSVIQIGSGSRQWCEHLHDDQDNALLCATQRRFFFQDPATSIDDLGRPEPKASPTHVAMHAPTPGLTDIAWSELKAMFGNSCRYCGAQSEHLEREHRVPMSRGGLNRITNIVPACHACNMAKGSATEQEFVEQCRETWGERIRKLPSKVEDKLGQLEMRYSPGYTENRSVTLLRSLGLKEGAAPWAKTAAVASAHGETTSIAGISFQSSNVERLLGNNKKWIGFVALICEPANQHDSNAVKLIARGSHIGYLPKALAARLSKEIQQLEYYGILVVARADVYANNHDSFGAVLKLRAPLETEKDF